MTNETDVVEAAATVGGSLLEAVVMCRYCTTKTPASHVFETSTGKETYTCEQHANLAMTCMKHLRRIGT